MARRTKSYAVALINDVDGIKTSFASVTSDTTYLPADFNGAQIASGGVIDLPRTVTITRSSLANAYSVNNIVVTGRRGGETVIENIAQPNDDGNDTLIGTQPFDVVTSIFVPANAAGTGAFQFGVRDICAPSGQNFVAIKPHASTSTLNVAYGAKAPQTDAIVINTALDIEPIECSRVVGSTNIGVTVYL